MRPQSGSFPSSLYCKQEILIIGLVLHLLHLDVMEDVQMPISRCQRRQIRIFWSDRFSRVVPKRVYCMWHGSQFVKYELLEDQRGIGFLL